MSTSIFQTVKVVGISHKHIARVVDMVLSYLGESTKEVTVHCVGTWRMKSLNYAERGVNRPTDVLSFPIVEKTDLFDTSDAGDIFMCPRYIQAQARRFAVSYREEFERMLIHGILHLFGYDHQKKKEAQEMFRIQEMLLKKINR